MKLNSYLKIKEYQKIVNSINEVNDESLCIVEENKKMAYILFWKRIENRRILLPRWTFGNSIFYKSLIKNVKIFFWMKKKQTVACMKLLIMVWGMCVTYTRLLLFKRHLNLLWRRLSYRFFNSFITISNGILSRGRFSWWLRS